MAKRGLYANINAKKKAGTSRTKSKSTITPEAYANMKAGFPNSKKNKTKAYGGGMMMKKKVKMKTGSTVKPDYLDMDKDGNKKESMKKAIKDKGKMYGGVAKKPKKMYGSTVKKPKKMGGGMAHSKKEKIMGKGVKHYLKSGKEWTGSFHKMKNGTLHTGNTHTKNSKVLVHFKDLSERAKKNSEVIVVAKKYQNPKGGLNEKGRKHFESRDGGNLRSPLKSGTSPRRVSFACRFAGMKGAMKDSKGRPTRKALALKAWGFGSVESASKFCQTHKKS